jgi:hypothetical protein
MKKFKNMEKNVHFIPTEQESNVYRSLLTDKYFVLSEKLLMNVSESNRENQFVYIIVDEIIREGDWFIGDGISIRQCTLNNAGNICFKGGWYSGSSNCKKIVLTNDPQLIKDGVQELTKEQLQALVECYPLNYVEVEEFNAYGVDNWKYSINFPPKGKIWHKNNDIESLINGIRARDENNRFSIDVYEYETFILTLGDEPDMQEMSFKKDEMKEIYNFLKQYYE